MPIYIGDYLADTQRLTTEQHGAYFLLLMDYWRSGKLPDNDQVLAQITRLSLDAWSNARSMLEQFFSIEDGFWVHKRVENELEQSAQNKAKKHERAVKAAKSRWNNATSNAQAMLDECPSPSPSPSPLTSDISMSGLTVPTCPQEKVLYLWKKHLPHLTQPRSWEGTRQQTLKQRWIQASKKSSYSDGYKTLSEGVSWWDSFFEYISKDTKLANGFENDGRTWKPTLEWVLKLENFQKIIDGKYNK